MFKVYWSYAKEAYSRDFDSMTDALAECESLRKHGRRFVTMVSEDLGNIGKPGVDSVVNGRTPDGVEYSWTKRR
jgi:hypothetical protein